MPGRFGCVVEEAARVELRDQPVEEALQLALRGDARLVRHQLARRRRVGRGPPLVGEDHHRLRQVERHVRRVQRVAHQRVGAGDVVVVEARRAPARTAPPRAGPSPLASRRSSAAARAVRTRLDDVAGPRAGGEDAVAVGDRRGQRRGRPARRPGCGRRRTPVRHARSCGQPSRGATRRRWNRPPFAMARAAAPMFSASCGRTSTTIGRLPGGGARSAPPFRPVMRAARWCPAARPPAGCPRPRAGRGCGRPRRSRAPCARRRAPRWPPRCAPASSAPPRSQ